MSGEHMQRALALAWDAVGLVSPRPPVGAVVVAPGGEVVGEGATKPRPGRHAEVEALEQAGRQARGATLYCTLEPHSFEGAAPPCTRAIIDAGVSNVVAAVTDPNPAVNGRGFRELREAGVAVELVDDSTTIERASELVEGFARHVRTGLPFVTAKLAMSLDGKIATRTGESQWITGEGARRHAHRLRHRADALITGIGTVLADDPRLTERDESGAATGRPRLRVVVDSDGRMPATARLLSEPGSILWVMGQHVRPDPDAKNVEVLNLPTVDGRVELRALIEELGRRDACNVLVEAGGEFLGSFFDAGLVDRVDAYIAPVVIGGQAAPGPVGGEGAASISQALKLQRVRYTPVGGDMLVTGYVDHRGRESHVTHRTGD